VWAGSRTQPSFRLRVAGLVYDIELGPAVLDAQHEVADDRGRGPVAEGDDDGGRQAGGLREQLAIAVEVGGTAG
jgi:hypothetical protein